MRTKATVQAPWQAVVRRLLAGLREKGFEVRRTFDLQLARQSLGRREPEPCPHHGAAPCSCQYLVFQISGPGRPLSALVIHGHDRTTTFTFFTGTVEQMDRDTADAVNEALEHLRPMRGAARQARSGQPAAVQGHHAVRRDRG